MKQLHYFGTLLLCSLIVACSSSQKKENVELVKVKVIKMQPSQVSATQGFSGTVEEMSGSILSFTVGGTLKKLLVTPGQSVCKGSLIGVLGDTSIKNVHNASMATLAQAKDAYQRMKQLHDSGSLPDIKWVETQSQLQQAISMEQIARKNLNDCLLYAAYNGVISDKFVEIGQNVSPGMPVVKLVKVDQVKIKIAIPENEIAQIKMHQPAIVKVLAIGNRSFQGNIVEKGISANPLSRSYEVKILIANSNTELMPGMVCQVELDHSFKQYVYVLPNHVLQLDDQNRSFVWVNVNGRAQKKIVHVSKLTINEVIVDAGLNSGDEVLVEGQQKVSQNTQITIDK